MLYNTAYIDIKSWTSFSFSAIFIPELLPVTFKIGYITPWHLFFAHFLMYLN